MPAKETATLTLPPVQTTVTAVLDERGGRYGSFVDNSRISQALKNLFDHEEESRARRGQMPLASHHREALDMMATKICRIFSGDPSYEDNWIDIAGYAELGRNPR